MLLIARDDRGKITFYYHLMIQGERLGEAVGDTDISVAVRGSWVEGRGAVW